MYLQHLDDFAAAMSQQKTEMNSHWLDRRDLPSVDWQDRIDLDFSWSISHTESSS